MRSFLFLIVLIVSLIGPYHYLTAGRTARAEHRAHLVGVRKAANDVRALLAKEIPPAASQLDVNRQRLDNVHRLIDRFVSGVRRASVAEMPTDAELIELGRVAQVDAGVLRPVLEVTAAGPDAGGGRIAVRALLHALAESKDLMIESLRIAPRSSPIGATGVERRNIEFAAVGNPTSAVHMVERLAAGSSEDPPGDIVEVTLDRTSENEWLRPGWEGEEPPMRVTVSVDLILVGAAP